MKKIIKRKLKRDLTTSISSSLFAGSGSIERRTYAVKQHRSTDVLPQTASSLSHGLVDPQGYRLALATATITYTILQ
jgi:hypothetical protein